MVLVVYQRLELLNVDIFIEIMFKNIQVEKRGEKIILLHIDEKNDVDRFIDPIKKIKNL